MDGEISKHNKKVHSEGVGQEYYFYKDSVLIWGVREGRN